MGSFRMRRTVYRMLFFSLLIFMTGLQADDCGPEWKKSLKKQNTLNHAERVDVNHFNMFVINNGLFANDPVTGHSGLEYPKGSQNYAIYTAGPCIVGVTKDTRELRAAAAFYSTDFQPGVILPNGAPDDPTQEKYKVYKFNKGDIVSQDAIDQGCPSEMIGDQMLYCVFNDANPVNHIAVWQTMPIGLEVHLLVWGYDGPVEPLTDIVFIRYELIHKGPADLDSVYIGVFFDPDLGEATDDYVACDPELGLGYVYNGDHSDVYYQDRPPAIGCDFLKGPTVPMPGYSARQMDGRILPDHMNLGITAFTKYIGSSSIYRDPRLQSAEGGIWAYNYLKGLVWDGSPFINPITGQPDPFVNSGDPVTGTGWLASAESPPGDNRFLMSSGPFTLAVGDTQEVVIGMVAGQGPNRLESISAMRLNDRSVQQIFDMGFQIPDSLPQPAVTAAEAHRFVTLYWDDRADGYESAGYAFEGYVVYEAEAPQGPWHRIAAFDRANQVTRIMEYGYSEALGYSTELITADGKNTGIQHYLNLTEDHAGSELVPGRPYYYAVTAYAVSPHTYAYPRVIETTKVPVTVRPHAAEMYTEQAADTSGIPVTLHAGEAKGLGDILADVTVIDPGQITGHEYRIDFLFDDSGDYEGYATGWRLTDLTQNRMAADRPGAVVEGLTEGIADGLLFHVQVLEPGVYGINPSKGIYSLYGPPYSGVSWTGSRTLTGFNAGGDSFFGGLMLGEDFQGSTCTPDQIAEVRIDIVSDGSIVTNCSVFERPGYAFKGVGTFPGAAYDIGDPANPRRLNLCFVEQVDSNAPDLKWDPIAAETGDETGGREYLYIMASDYVVDPSTLYNDNNPGRSADVMYGLWTKPRGNSDILGDWSLTVHALKPVRPGNYIAFSTEGLAPVKSVETAAERLDRIQVYPNPYFGYNPQETETYEHFVTFINLPESRCAIRIFSLSGQLIRTIEHNNGTVFDRWDLCNASDLRLRVASGMYIAHIDVPGVGTRILKLAVISPRD